MRWVYSWVCTCHGTCVEVRGQHGRGQFSPPTLSEVVFLVSVAVLHNAGWLPSFWVSLSFLPPSSFERAGITDACHQNLTLYVGGFQGWTQVIRLAQQALLPTKPSFPFVTRKAVPWQQGMLFSDYTMKLRTIWPYGRQLIDIWLDRWRDTVIMCCLGNSKHSIGDAHHRAHPTPLGYRCAYQFLAFKARLLQVEQRWVKTVTLVVTHILFLAGVEKWWGGI